MPNLHLEPGHLLDDLIAIGLNLPKEDRYFRHPQTNKLRPVLEDLADCYRAALKVQSERKGALVRGIPAPERAGTPVGRAATTEGK